MSERSGPPWSAKWVMSLGRCFRQAGVSAVGSAFARSARFRRFNSLKASEVSQGSDTESQYSRSARSRVDREGWVEEGLAEQDLIEGLRLLAGCSRYSSESSEVFWCSDERVLCFRFRPVGGCWESGATVGLGEDESQGRVS